MTSINKSTKSRPDKAASSLADTEGGWAIDGGRGERETLAGSRSPLRAPRDGSFKTQTSGY